MATESELGIGQGKALQAAAKRFPRSEFTIRRLLHSNETFRELCEELADAEAALANVPESVAALQQAREREWQELVQELVSEVEQALKRFEIGP
ncbi:hypothetical protein IHQ71_27770 [Rhizobium sp. TH2]|uniref:hypothetical protein n=1 Tax=Rhizobium sp. TH2 TaxID=2775403 RepID=UPI0021587182|nr:hypothetical protein [Rhizobium sp. TH2]UVC08871.1 hypothetical protein IHQ71_27770 [Rhizobium sp. TH2]